MPTDSRPHPATSTRRPARTVEVDVDDLLADCSPDRRTMFAARPARWWPDLVAALAEVHDPAATTDLARRRRHHLVGAPRGSLAGGRRLIPAVPSRRGLTRLTRPCD